MRIARLFTAVSVALSLGLAGLVLLASPALADYESEPEETWVPNGAVLAIAAHGDRVYLGGRFTSLRNTATGEVVNRTRLAALDAATGQLVPTWTATANGDVRSMAVSDDGTRLFIGGGFTNVSGSLKRRVAALDATSGLLIPGWQGWANKMVWDLALVGNRLFVGGIFSTVNGAPRSALAAVDATTGELEADWAPSATNVRALAPSPDGLALVVGGSFAELGGAPRLFLGSVALDTGAVTAWDPAEPCPTCDVLDVATDTSSVYAAHGGPGGRLSAYDSTSGRRRWNLGADGDVQAVAVHDGLVYGGGHFKERLGGEARYQLAAADAQTGSVDLDFVPVLRRPRGGVWAISPGIDRLRVGGFFEHVQNSSQARYAEFRTAVV